MLTIAELLQLKGELLAKAREIVDIAAKANREMTPEEVITFDKIDNDMLDVQAKLDRAQRIEQLDAQGAVAVEGNTGGTEEVTNPLATPEYMAGFEQFVRVGPHGLPADIVAVLNTGVTTEGGHLVPVEYETTLIQSLENQNIMRMLASVVTSGSDRKIPIETDAGAAAWMLENGTYPESDSAFGQVTVDAFKLGRIIKISEELLQDAFFDMQSYITGAFQRSFGNAEETAFVVGDGTNKPTGVIPSAEVGHTAALTSAITTDELIDLFHSLKRAYRRNGTFMFNDTLAKAIRKLKDSNGQYVWQPGLVAGQPDTLLGRPVAISDDVAGFAANALVMAFGDFSYYRIQDRVGISMQRLNELYAGSGQVGFRMNKRTDGKLLLPEAVKSLKMAAV